MDVQLSGETVLLLGPGNELDRVILRALASEGAWTYATQSSASTSDLTQEATGASHWVSEENDLDARTVARVSRFLADQGRPATAIVMHVDVIGALTARGPLRWWRFRSEARAVMKSVSDALGAATPSVRRSLLLLYQLNYHSELPLAARWLERTINAVVQRSPDDARVNAVLVAPGEVDAGTANVVALLCSPSTARMSGAFIPMDGGAAARDYARFES